MSGFVVSLNVDVGYYSYFELLCLRVPISSNIAPWLGIKSGMDGNGKTEQRPSYSKIQLLLLYFFTVLCAPGYNTVRTSKVV